MVTRETSIPAGLAALGLTPDRHPELADRLRKFRGLLLGEAVPRGLLGPDEGTRMISRHILESVALGGFLPAAGRLLDIGSGAGLPGIPLACLRSDPVTLLEPQGKRATFLRRAIHALGLGAGVVRARAETVGRGALRGSADCVTARALAPPATVLELALPLVRLGGRIVVPVGEQAGQSLEAARTAASTLGGSEPGVVGFEVPGVEERRWVMIVEKLHPTPSRFPRSAAAIRRRPLGSGVERVNYRG